MLTKVSIRVPSSSLVSFARTSMLVVAASSKTVAVSATATGASLTGVTTIVKICVAVKAPSPSSVAVIVISEPISPSVGVPDNVLSVNVNQLGNPVALTVTKSPSISSVVIS